MSYCEDLATISTKNEESYLVLGVHDQGDRAVGDSLVDIFCHVAPGQNVPELSHLR